MMRLLIDIHKFFTESRKVAIAFPSVVTHDTPTFSEYQITPECSTYFPTLAIAPYAEHANFDGIFAPELDAIFTKNYFEKNHAILVENGYFARGDDRSPEAINYVIPPKCSEENTGPHYDVFEHRSDSDCSGFVSLTDEMRVAHVFGDRYDRWDKTISYYYIYMAEMKWGLVLDPTHDKYHSESEISAIGPVPIVSYAKCRDECCSSLFIRDNVDPVVKNKILAAHVSAKQTATLVKPLKVYLLELAGFFSSANKTAISNNSGRVEVPEKKHQP